MLGQGDLLRAFIDRRGRLLPGEGVTVRGHRGLFLTVFFEH
jgi:hypothetical protein